MYELIQVTDRSCYIQCPAKIGLVRLEGDRVCLIDSGSDKDAGRKVRQILDANGWRLTAIYPEWSATLRSTQFWSRPFYTGAIPSGSFGTSF